jgi:hypothetical protein
MTVRVRRLPDDSGARSTGRRAESVSESFGRSSPGPESPDSFLPASSDKRSIASWQHWRLTLPGWPAIAGRPAVRRSPFVLPPESSSRHDRSRHSCKHERFPNGPFRRFVPSVRTPHGKPRDTLTFGSRRLPCPFRRHRLMRRSSNPESTRRRPSIRFGTGLPPEGDLLAPPRLSRRQVGGLAPRKRDVRPSVSVGPGRPLMASTCCRVDGHRMTGLSPVFGRRGLNPSDSRTPGICSVRCASPVWQANPVPHASPPSPQVCSSPGPVDAAETTSTRPCRLRTGGYPNDGYLPCNGSRPSLPTCSACLSPISALHRPVGPETGLPQQRSASIRSTRGPSGFQR